VKRLGLKQPEIKEWGNQRWREWRIIAATWCNGRRKKRRVRAR